MVCQTWINKLQTVAIFFVGGGTKYWYHILTIKGGYLDNS